MSKIKSPRRLITISVLCLSQAGGQARTPLTDEEIGEAAEAIRVSVPDVKEQLDEKNWPVEQNPVEALERHGGVKIGRPADWKAKPRLKSEARLGDLSDWDIKASTGSFNLMLYSRDAHGAPVYNENNRHSSVWKDYVPFFTFDRLCTLNDIALARSIVLSRQNLAKQADVLQKAVAVLLHREFVNRFVWTESRTNSTGELLTLTAYNCRQLPDKKES